MPTLLEIKNLSKYFARFSALQNVSLEINQGEIFGLLGPNAAGKTTFIKCIFNFLKISRGEIFYQGKPLSSADIHKYFGYLPENFLPPRELTAFQFLKYLSLALGVSVKNIENILGQLKLDPHKKISNYSRGMIQRLGLAQVLIKGPEFIILDEPTLGLDPQAQLKILDLLTALNRKGKTILFSSHDLFHIERICNKVSILDKGQIKYTGLTKSLLKKHNTSSLEEAYLGELC